MFPQYVAETICHGLDIGERDRFLTVAVHAFMTALQTQLKALIGKVGVGHGILSRFQDAPGKVVAKLQITVTRARTQFPGDRTAGGQDVQQRIQPIGWADALSLCEADLRSLLGAAIVASESLFVIAPAQEFIRAGQQIAQAGRAELIGISKVLEVGAKLLGKLGGVADGVAVVHPLPFVQAKCSIARVENVGLRVNPQQARDSEKGAVAKKFFGCAEVALEEKVTQVEGLNDFGASLDYAIHAIAAGEINLVHFLVERCQSGAGTHLLRAAGRVDDQSLIFLQLPLGGGDDFAHDPPAFVDVVVV